MLRKPVVSSKLVTKLVQILVFLPFIVLCAVVISYRSVPTGNTDATHFDTLVVLGCPPNPDGSASSEERERVLAAVREFRSGHADHMIMTGGAAHSPQAESEVMASIAASEGIPREAVLIESQAKDTIENIHFSHEIMARNRWTTAEVVSSPSHLARAALILEHYRFGWKVKASKWPPEYSWRRIAPYYVREALGTTWFRWFGFHSTPYMPKAQDALYQGFRSDAELGRL